MDATRSGRAGRLCVRGNNPVKNVDASGESHFYKYSYALFFLKESTVKNRILLIYAGGAFLSGVFFTILAVSGKTYTSIPHTVLIAAAVLAFIVCLFF